MIKRSDSLKHDYTGDNGGSHERNYVSNYIYKCIKNLDDKDQVKSKEAYNKLSSHIKKHPESLYSQSSIYGSIYTPYIYAASINLNTLIQLHNIYQALSKNLDLPDIYIEPYEFKNIKGDTLIHYITHRIIKDKPGVKNMYLMLEYILDTINVNINAVDKNGNTALHLASKFNKMDLVKVLLFHGINPNIINYEKKIALNYAVINNNVDIFKILLYKNSNYKYAKNERNYDSFIEMIDRYKKKVSRKIVNTTKKIKSIKRNKLLQSRHVFLCNEICYKLESINNDVNFKKYKTELRYIAEHLNVDMSKLNLQESHIEMELNMYKNLCKLISHKILMKKSLKK